MKLGFVFDVRFVKYNGNFYATSLSVETLTERYLSVFDEMVVVGRYKEVTESPQGKLVQCNNERIEFKCVRDEHPLKRVLHFGRENKSLREALCDCDAVVCRGWRGTGTSRKLGKPYMVEVVNCAWDSYWNHSLLGKIVAPAMFLIRRITTKNAPYVQYVTNEFLQRRYPTKGKSVGVSDVALVAAPDKDILKNRLEKISSKSPDGKIVIGTAAAVNVKFKGQRFVIKALAKLKRQGLTNFEYQIAGGGSNHKLKALAEKLGVSDQVVFKGSIIHSEIFAWLDSLDVYVQPSLQEGLPRAMIEAMSRGLPCYGTKTGGIPELIGAPYVCKSNHRIADKLASFLKNHTAEKALLMAQENYAESQKYQIEGLKLRFYQFLKEFSQSVTNDQY